MKTTTVTHSLAIIILGLSSAASAADKTLIYKSIDADGTTVFTDQPAPESTIVTPAPLNVVDQSPATTSSLPSPQPSSSTTALATTVDSVSIVSPTDQQTFIDPQSDLWVEFSLSPSDTLPDDLRAQVLLDGEVGSTGSSNRLPILIPERGTHSIQIQLIDPQGSVQSESDVINIHVRHHVAGGGN